VTNIIAAIEQETREAISENRRGLAEETSRINRDADLSDAAKARYLAEARERAHRTHAEITEAHEKAITERLEQNERKLFRLRYPEDSPTPSQKKTFRMGYRQCALALLGASEETYRERYSQAAGAWDSYVRDRRAAASRENLLVNAILKTQGA
jgi:hypothetical protein